MRLTILRLAMPLLIAQTPPPSVVDQIIENERKLEYTLQLDKQVYFINEEATVTVTVRNATTGALTVAAPFHQRTGGFVQWEKKPDGSWVFSNSDYPEFPFDESTPTTVLNGGEQRQLSLKSHDSTFGSALSVMLGGSTPPRAGQYRIRYNLGNGQAEFQVVEPLFEVAAQATLNDPDVYTENGEQKSLSRHIYVFAARWDGTSYICVAKPTTADAMRYPPPGQPVTHSYISGLVELKRVFSSPTPVSQLQVSEDGQGNFTILYTLANSQQGTIHLNANREPI